MTTDKKHRCYDQDTCPYHEIIDESVKKALPRWVFVWVLGGVLTVALIFAAWHLSTLNKFDETYRTQVAEFTKVARANNDILIEVRTRQQVVINKIEKLEDKINKN